MLVKSVYFVGCLIVLFMLAGIRSAPIYGKLDFLLLNSKPWWPAWKPMLEELEKEKVVKVYSDPVTNIVLLGVFDIRAPKYRPLRRDRVISIELLEKESQEDGGICLVNLRGFRPSWVPSETYHWQEDLGETIWFYSYAGKRGAEMIDSLHENPPQNCEIYY